jgi:hypothetical protein
MRGGSEIMDQQEVLLEGAYITDMRNLREFRVYQIDDNVMISFNQGVNLPLLPPMQLTLREYQQEFLPVVDSGAYNPQHRRFTFRGTTWPGSWWSRAILEVPVGNAGGKHRRKCSAHKHHHKRSGKSHKRSGKSRRH